jgi:hypothetical protein
MRDMQQRLDRAEWRAANPPELKLTLDSFPDLNVNVKRDPSGVDIIRDHAGNVIGARPSNDKPKDKVADALKKTQAAQTIAKAVEPPEIE